MGIRKPASVSRANPDDQLKLLLNCVKHSNNGKVGRIKFILRRDTKAEGDQITFIEVA